MDVDLLKDALDCLQQAEQLSSEVDPELEAITCQHLGKIWYLGFRNLEKAKKHYTGCIRLASTLAKDFTKEQWFKTASIHLQEIRQKILELDPEY